MNRGNIYAYCKKRRIVFAIIMLGFIAGAYYCFYNRHYNLCWLLSIVWVVLLERVASIIPYSYRKGIGFRSRLRTPYTYLGIGLFLVGIIIFIINRIHLVRIYDLLKPLHLVYSGIIIWSMQMINCYLDIKTIGRIRAKYGEKSVKETQNKKKELDFIELNKMSLDDMLNNLKRM